MLLSDEDEGLLQQYAFQDVDEVLSAEQLQNAVVESLVCFELNLFL